MNRHVLMPQHDPSEAFRARRANAPRIDRSDEIPFATDEQLSHWLKQARDELKTIRGFADVALTHVNRVLHILDPRNEPPR